MTLLCHQIWNSEKAILKVKDTPALFLSGSKDELIPPIHMKVLYKALQSVTKKDDGACQVDFVTFENGTHNDTCMQAGYFEAIEEFWNRCIAIK